MNTTHPAQLLKRDGGPALYLQVADFLRAQIIDGTWRSGDKLPSLGVLMEEFGVARVTVRDAVRVLTQEGLLQSQRGRGTTVMERAKGHRHLKMYAEFGRMVEVLKNDRPVPENVKQETISPDLTNVSGRPVDSYEFIERTHMRDEVSYCLISLYLDRRLYLCAPERFQNELVLPVLSEIAPTEMASIEQIMRFGKCGRMLADRLKYPYGDPVAHLSRVIRNADDQIVYFANVSYRADLLELDFGTS